MSRAARRIQNDEHHDFKMSVFPDDGPIFHDYVRGPRDPQGVSEVRREVTIRFDRQTQEWVMENEKGQVVQRHHAQELTAESILNFQIAKRNRSN